MSLPVFNIKLFKIHLKFKIKNLKLTKGFTLIELLVVISIIAILMAVASVSYLNAQQKGRDNKRKSDLKAVQQALEIYYNQNGKYPYLGTTVGQISCTSGVGGTSWGSTFTCGSSPAVTYMNPLPKDPIQNWGTGYRYWSDNSTTPANQTYQLYAKIENSGDQDLKYTVQSQCANPPGTTWQTKTLPDPPGTLYYFCVTNP